MIWLASTVTIVVLLFGYHTSTNDTSETTGARSRGGPTSPEPDPSSAAPTPDPRPGLPSSSGRSAVPSVVTTTTGSVAQTRWGPVQVQIGVQRRKIIKVRVLQRPDGNRRNVEVNDYALPILIDETVDAQSADIDMVSGATVTSTGYRQSLQAALDQAGI